MTELKGQGTGNARCTNVQEKLEITSIGVPELKYSYLNTFETGDRVVTLSPLQVGKKYNIQVEPIEG